MLTPSSFSYLLTSQLQFFSSYFFSQSLLFISLTLSLSYSHLLISHLSLSYSLTLLPSALSLSHTLTFCTLLLFNSLTLSLCYLLTFLLSYLSPSALSHLLILSPSALTYFFISHSLSLYTLDLSSLLSTPSTTSLLHFSKKKKCIKSHKILTQNLSLKTLKKPLKKPLKNTHSKQTNKQHIIIIIK